MNYANLIERMDEYESHWLGSAVVSDAATALRELVAERDALLGLIRFALAPHVHPDMTEAMIREALAGGGE